MEIENYNPYSWHKDEYPYAVKVPDAAKNEIVSWREESNVDLLYIFAPFISRQSKMPCFSS
jgi:hypothetical protein